MTPEEGAGSGADSGVDTGSDRGIDTDSGVDPGVVMVSSLLTFHLPSGASCRAPAALSGTYC